MRRTTSQVAKSRRYIARRLKAVNKDLKVCEALFKSAENYRSRRIGGVINSNNIGLDVAVSIVVMAMPSIIKAHKINRNLFNRSLRLKR